MTVCWSYTDLNEKLPKNRLSKQTKQRLNINFKVYSFLQTPSPWGRGWDILAFEYQLYFISICLLMKQCSRVGIPVEQPFTYKVMTFDFYDSFQFLKRNQAFFGLSSVRRRLSYILILTGYKTAITLLDVSDLNEVVLENIILSKHWLCRSVENRSQTPFPLKGLGIDCWNPINFCQLSSNRYSVHYLESYVLKIALLGRLWLPITKQTWDRGFESH